MYKYRVFISYSHQDIELARQIVKILEANGLRAMWDEDFAYGHGFQEQIKKFIAHAHVFLPVVTESSSKRGWVHQEIGYAMALRVPVLPVALGTLPGEMIQELQAVVLKKDLSNLQEQLSRDAFNNLVELSLQSSLALYECAELHEDRTAMMARYANDVLTLRAHGLVRQKGGLTSFNIPGKVISHPIWQKRSSPSTPNKFLNKLQRDERLALEKHASQSGCRLIINPNAHEDSSSSSRMARLKTLLDFLGSIPDSKVQVAINPEMEKYESLTIVGDWFLAECVSSPLEKRYQQTIFTRHAPTIWNQVELFDEEFKELLNERGLKPETSRTEAIKQLNEKINEIKRSST